MLIYKLKLCDLQFIMCYLAIHHLYMQIRMFKLNVSMVLENLHNVLQYTGVYNYVGICESRHLKGEMAWTIDKWLNNMYNVICIGNCMYLHAIKEYLYK